LPLHRQSRQPGDARGRRAGRFRLRDPRDPPGEGLSAGFREFASGRLAPHGLTLRAVLPDDAASVARVYASTRDEELRQVAWNDAQKQAFTGWQSQQQEAHYTLHYPNAERLLVERAGAVIGRIYVDTARLEVRLMEVTLLPESRNQGIGSRLMAVFLDY